uniref:Uncharacterized protein n=1 Tax=Anguilla anguilla TaxID=7936 RepID=A0A0E9PYR5_ANGAN
MRDTKTGTSRIFRNVPHYTDFNIMHNQNQFLQMILFQCAGAHTFRPH